MNLEISPSATDEEVAAIVAAVEAMWPRAIVIEPAASIRKPTWRFSNRWWISPLPTRRERPRRH
jgi:hypothetical protein